MIFLPRSRNVRKPTKRELSVSPLHNCTTLKGIQLCRPRCHLQVSLTVSRMMTPRCRKRWIVLKSAVFVRLALCALTRIMPSEKAWAYRMKLEAIKHQGARTDLTSVQVEQKLSARDKVAKDAGEKSGIQIMRYIRLTELIPELLDMVDEKKIAFNPAYELSFLKKEEQIQLLDAMDSEQATPSLSQAQRLKKFSQEGRLSIDVMRAIMGEEKKSDLDKVTFTSDTLRKYFPKSYTPARMQETIIKLLEQWQKKRQQQHER